MNNLNPPRLNTMLRVVETSRNLRSNSKIILHKPITKSKMSDRNVRNRGVDYWSELNSETQTSKTLAQFKARLKAHGKTVNKHEVRI